MRTTRPLYREVLKDAGLITWRNKHLWPFGFFAAILLSGSPYDLLSRCFYFVTDSAPDFSGGSAALTILKTTGEVLAVGFRGGLIWSLPVLIAILLVIGAALIWLSVVSQGALLSAISAEEEKKKPNLQIFFQRGVKHFWPLLAVNVLLRLSIALAALIAAAILTPAAASSNLAFQAGIVIAFLILLPLAYLAINIAFFAEMGIVRFKERLGEAIRNAWLLITRHWLVVLETSALVLLIDIALAIAATVAATLFSIPFLALFLLALLSRSLLVFWAVLTLFILTITALILTVASAAVTFHYSVWVLLSERLRKNDPVIAKIMRLYDQIKNAVRR